MEPKKHTPAIDEYVHSRDTFIPCLLCSDENPRPRCPLCNGAGSVSPERARVWREAHPLPPMNPPPRKK